MALSTQPKLHAHPARWLGQVLLAIALFLSASTAALAQDIRVIRDAETERLIRDFAAPLLEAAGMRSLRRVYLVADRRFNAFVIEDGSMFIHYGTIVDARTPNELKAVIAHEIGHLAGGHLTRIREQTEVNAKLRILASALGIGVLAASQGNAEIGRMASAFIYASQSVGANALAAYRQSEESAADAAALRFLADSGQSAHGLVGVLEYLKSQQSVGAASYLRSHPLAEDRLAQVTSKARESRYWGRSDSASDTRRFEMVQAKLSGFLDSQSAVLNRYPNGDSSLPARYARIIAAYKGGGGISALQFMPQIVASDARNPFLHELLGQMYFETGQPDKALASLKRAVDLAPDETQIRILYGHALLETGSPANLAEAELQLTRAAREDQGSGHAFGLLARAQTGLGKVAAASLSAAEAAILRGDRGTALGLARQAQAQSERGSSVWLRADDILSLNR